MRIERVVGCVVTSPVNGAASTLRALANPANEALVGTSRPYFPRGGPLPAPPPRGLQSSAMGWGGMDAGQNMLYPAQTVDGLVHQHGGRRLRELLAEAAPVLELRSHDDDHVRCRVGDAVLTAAPPTLPYDVIAHTPPPFWGDAEWEDRLTGSYASALRVATRAAAGAGKTSLLLATPIMGAGARGAPTREAARVLARALRSPASAVAEGGECGVEVVVRVVVPDAESERVLQEELDARG